MDHGPLTCPENMVLVNEIVDDVDHFMRGIPLNEENLDVDLL